MRFSVVLATCMEGLLYPPPSIGEDTFIRVAMAAESKGYHSVWANDHITTQQYVRAEFSEPSRYYDPFITLSYLSGLTKRLRLGIAVVVLPLREPVILAKQISTLDVFCGGRLDIVVGIGAYREEFEALHPDSKGVNRGDMLEEGIQCLITLFNDRIASYHGEYFNFQNIESFPKPKQNPFPFMVGGNSAKHLVRVARWGYGWFPAVLSPEELKVGVDKLYVEAQKFGRENISFEIAPQYAVTIGKTHEEAVMRFCKSHLYKHMVSLEKTTLKDQASGIIERNLIGTADEIIERIQKLEEAGMTHCAALIFPASNIDEVIEQMDEFAEKVFPEFDIH
jgi:probable F420-dependent oxidoreductase